jgi:hypothetical protein
VDVIGRLAAACALVAGAGCTLVTDSFLTNDFSGDQYPIDIDVSSGAVMMGLRQRGAEDRGAVMDLLSPVTLVDPGPNVAPSVTLADVFILGAHGPGGPIEQPRAKLTEAQLIALHPCETDDCVVGSSASPLPYQAIIGADVLAGDAVRLRLGDSQIFVLPDIGGDTHHRTYACDAVFPSPYRGGGTLIIAGTELSFGGRRVAIQTCLGADPDPMKPQSLRGSDALLVMSTGVGVSILGETAYARYRLAHPTAPAQSALPQVTVNLPSGPITGSLATLDTLALVASSSSSPLAACRQVYGSHLILQRDCELGDDCPCEDGDVFCSQPAIVELRPPTGLEMLVVNDANPTLQALRTELRPDQAEVDGILGTNALLAAELDIDYPHNRVLARCSGDGCITRPQLEGRTDRTQIQGCLGPNPVGPIF